MALESSGILDVNCDLDVFALHHVYIVRINRHLEKFISGWNSHPVRTESNMTPNQLWINGLCNIAGTGTLVDKEIWEPKTNVSCNFLICYCVSLLLVMGYDKTTIHLKFVVLISSSKWSNICLTIIALTVRCIDLII